MLSGIAILTQAGKADESQQRLADALPAYDAASGVADAVVVGCGPAGLALAAELARRNVQVVLIGAPPILRMLFIAIALLRLRHVPELSKRRADCVPAAGVWNQHFAR